MHSIMLAFSLHMPAAKTTAAVARLLVLVLDICSAGVRLERLLHVAVLPVAVETVGQVPVHRLLEALLPGHLPQADD